MREDIYVARMEYDFSGFSLRRGRVGDAMDITGSESMMVSVLQEFFRGEEMQTPTTQAIEDVARSALWVVWWP